MKISKFHNLLASVNLQNYSMVKMFFISTILSILFVKCTNSIVIPEFSEYVEDYGDRDLIIGEDAEQARVHELSRMIPCVLSFIETYMNESSRIPVLLPKNVTEFSKVPQLFLSPLQRIRSTFVLRGYLDPKSDHMNTLSSLIIIEDFAQLKNMKSQLINLCGRSCKYLIALTSVFLDEATFLMESKKLVELLWNRRIANVVFLGVVKQTVFISRSLSFKAHITTEPSTPVLVAKCYKNSNSNGSKWFAASEIYSPLRMNKSIVHVAFFEQAPYVGRSRFQKSSLSNESSLFSNSSIEKQSHVNNDSGDVSRDNVNREAAIESEVSISRLSGIEGQIVNILASSMNFVISGKKLPNMKGLTTAEKVHDAIWGKGMEDIDMVLGGLPWASAEETDYTLPYDVVQIVWLLPIRPNVSLHGLIAPLRTDVWFAVLGLLVFASCIEFVISRNVSFLEILSLVIGVAWPRQPTVLSSRIRFISWVIFGYVLTQCYLASMAGQLMASSGMQIETLRELIDSSFEIGGSANVKSLFNQTDEPEAEEDDDGEPDTNEINEIMEEKFQVFENEEFTKRFNDLIEEKNMNLALAVTMNISSMKPSFEGKLVHRMREALSSTPLSFAVWRGMPYLNIMDKKISNLIEGGIVGWWARHISLIEGGYYDTNVDENNNENNLTLNALVPGFLLLIMGYGLAGLSLFIETAVFHWRNRRVKKLTEKKLKRNITQKKSILRTPGRLKRNENTVKNVMESLDTRAWIVGFNNRHDHERRNDNYFTQRVHFDFVH